MRGLRSQRQLSIAVTYKEAEVREPLFLDILVENKIIIEVKATRKNYPFYQAQLLTYLRLTQKEPGILINFGHDCIQEGIYRVINPLKSN